LKTADHRGGNDDINSKKDRERQLGKQPDVDRGYQNFAESKKRE